KAENFQAIHLLVPRRGVAVHINAFNFPSWGLWEKAAVALISGIPVLAKPASATALLAHAMVRDVIAAKILPEGALSLLVGGAGDLLAALTSEDVVAFTGSADTAARVRGGLRWHPPARRGSKIGLRRHRAARDRRHRSQQGGFCRADAPEARRCGQRARRARGRGVWPGGDGGALSRRAGRLHAGGARRRLAGGLGLRRGQGISDAHRERDRAKPRPRARGRSRDRERAYRSRHRHAAMQSRRPRPRRQRRGVGRAAGPSPLSPASGGAGLDRPARQPAGQGGEPALSRVIDTLPPALAVFTPAERRLIARLRTPNLMQRYLNRLPYNSEPRGETLRSFRQVLRHGKAHCSEAALLAACVLEQHGYPPLLMTFESVDLLDHVIFVYRARGRWGSVARSRDPGLHGRKPVFRTPRELA